MHKIPRWVLRIGWTLFALGLLVVMFAGTVIDNVDTPPESEDWSGTLMFKGETPATYDVELNVFSSYYVFVQEGANITVEILNGNDHNYFEPCENDDDCDMYDIEGNISGYEYIGEILIDDKGEYDITFTEENGEAVEVMIREDQGFQSFLMIAGGSVGCFVGLLFLIIGGIMAMIMKESIDVDLSSQESPKSIQEVQSDD